MVVVEPTPRGDTTVIVVHDPLQTLYISIDEVKHILRVVVADFEFALKYID